MKIVTSIGLFNDAVGKRISITYSEVENGQVMSDNKRIDRVITETGAIEHAEAIAKYAQEFVDAEE